MNLSDRDLKTLDEIQTYNQGLANALRRACGVAEEHGRSEQEVERMDAEYAANDAFTQARLRGERGVKHQIKMSIDQCLEITGIRLHEMETFCGNYSDKVVGFELEKLAKEITNGKIFQNTYGVLKYRLSKYTPSPKQQELSA